MSGHPVKVLVFPQESPIERAAHSAVVALEDLEAAVHCAKSLPDLDLVTALAAELGERIWQCERTVRTYRAQLQEHTCQ